MRRCKKTRKCDMCGTAYFPWQKRTNNSYCSVPCRQRGNGTKGGAANGDRLRGTGVGYIKQGGRHQHRVVMEQILGRALRKGEVVHHINGIKSDNRPRNLVVITQSEHIDLHRTALIKGQKRKAG